MAAGSMNEPTEGMVGRGRGGGMVQVQEEGSLNVGVVEY